MAAGSFLYACGTSFAQGSLYPFPERTVFMRTRPVLTIDAPSRGVGSSERLRFDVSEQNRIM